MKNSILLTIKTKFISLAILLVAATVFITDQIYYNNSEDILVSAEIRTLEEEARLLLAPVRKSINALKIDVRALYANPSLLAVIEKKTAQNLDALASDFKALLQANPYYTQARFLNEDGVEMLRLNRKGDLIQRLPKKHLQDKSGSVYFNEAVQMEPGEVYLSDINPNRENGQIIRPIVNVLRGAIPVFRKDASLAGTLIINLNVSRLLSELSKETDARRSLYVTNTEGEYLLHPERDKMLGVKPEKFTIQDEFPKSQQVTEGDKRKLLAETKNGLILSYLSLPFDKQNPDRQLGIGLTASRDLLLRDVHNLRLKNMLLSAGLVLIAGFVAALFGRIITLPLTRIADLADQFPEKDDVTDLPVKRSDEIGQLARSYTRLVTEVSKQEWIRTGQLEVVSAARGKTSTKDTAYGTLKKLCLYLDAPLGAFYMADAKGRLTLLQGYAIKGNNKAEKEFQSGESMLSSVLEDGLVKISNDIPKDYYRMHSGLGDTLPTHRIIAPIIIEREPLGVIEIASLKPFTEQHKVLMERVAEDIGLTIIASKAREEVESMLEEAQTQQEELRVSNEALENKTKELEESQDELRNQAQALEQANANMESQSAEIEQQNKTLGTQAAELTSRMQQIEQASKYKSEFLANMSHELRTPLNSLLILAKSFKENEDGNLTTGQMEEADMIYNGGVELLTLINDVLDFSKIEAGKISVLKDHEPLDGIAKKLEKQFKPVVKEKNIGFSVSIQDDCPDTIHTDVQRIEQILKNLLSNAIKFTDQGSVSVDIFTQGEYIAFAVKDTGIGIDKDKLRDIFEAFQQEDGSIDRKYGGTGLGLSISNQLAELLGGKITLESEKNKGSTFTLWLPLAELNQDEPSEKKVLPMPLPDVMQQTFSQEGSDTKSILIIEDDTRFAKTLDKLVKKQGYEATIVASGKDAIMHVETSKPSAIILDLMLPDMDGLQILDQLKSNIKTRHIPVHVISAREGKEKDTIKKGAVGYLTKPVSPEQIDSMFATVANINQDAVKRVLVVEDDTTTQKAIEKLLNNKKLELTVAGTGEAALEHIKEGGFDCIILDLQLPDTTGFEWLKKVEKIEGGVIPPVIVYTARKLTKDEAMKLEEYTGSIIIKGAHSPERLVDEVSLFLHSVEETLSDEQRKMILAQHNPNEVLESRKILLVDDDMRNVFAMSKMLKKQGMDVIVADNGKTALEQLDKEEDIALVIMDIMMPEMDGYEATKAIREHPRYKEVPVVALTARTMPDEKQKCLSAGANDYLAKPVDIDVLLALLRILLFNNEKAA